MKNELAPRDLLLLQHRKWQEHEEEKKGHKPISLDTTARGIAIVSSILGIGSILLTLEIVDTKTRPLEVEIFNAQNSTRLLQLQIDELRKSQEENLLGDCIIEGIIVGWKQENINLDTCVAQRKLWISQYRETQRKK